MPLKTPARLRSFARPGRLVPREARGIRSRAILLKSGESMAWHSTQAREELILMLHGTVELAMRLAQGRVRSVRLRAGQCAWLPAQTWHRLNNPARQPAHYVYVTAAVESHPSTPPARLASPNETVGVARDSALWAKRKAPRVLPVRLHGRSTR